MRGLRSVEGCLRRCSHHGGIRQWARTKPTPETFSPARRAARDERKSADVGEAALLRAQALHALGRSADAQADASLAAEALALGLGPDHALTEAAKALALAVTPQRLVPH